MKPQAPPKRTLVWVALSMVYGYIRAEPEALFFRGYIGEGFDTRLVCRPVGWVCGDYTTDA